MQSQLHIGSLFKPDCTIFLSDKPGERRFLRSTLAVLFSSIFVMLLSQSKRIAILARKTGMLGVPRELYIKDGTLLLGLLFSPSPPILLTHTIASLPSSAGPPPPAGYNACGRTSHYS
jgi:hypothetical protein